MLKNCKTMKTSEEKEWYCVQTVECKQIDLHRNILHGYHFLKVFIHSLKYSLNCSNKLVPVIVLDNGSENNILKVQTNSK